MRIPSLLAYLAKEPIDISYDADIFDLSAFNEEFRREWALRPPRDDDEAESLFEDTLYHGQWSSQAGLSREAARFALEDIGADEAKDDEIMDGGNG